MRKALRGGGVFRELMWGPPLILAIAALACAPHSWWGEGGATAPPPPNIVPDSGNSSRVLIGMSVLGTHTTDSMLQQ